MAAVVNTVFSQLPDIVVNASKPALNVKKTKAKPTTAARKPSATDTSPISLSSVKPAVTNANATTLPIHENQISNEETIITTQDSTLATFVHHHSQNASIQTAPTNNASQTSIHTTGSTPALFPHFNPLNLRIHQTPSSSYAAHTFIQVTFGYIFKNVNLINEALDTTTRMYRPDSNKSLALIGDSVLQTNIVRDWYLMWESRGTNPKSRSA
jgi:hypothetical protein